IFGEGNRGNVFNLLNQIASGRFMMIGKGDNQKSMSYIGNIVACIEILMLNGLTGYNAYNYVDKPDFTTNDLVFHTGAILNKKIPTVRIPYRFGMHGRYGCDISAFICRRKRQISSTQGRKCCAVTQYDTTKARRSSFAR